MAQRYETNAPSVIFEDFGDETILIHLDTGFYYSLDATGMAVWDLLSSRFTTEEVCSRLDDDYEHAGNEMQEAVETFLGKLLEEGLVRESEQTAADEKPEATVNRQKVRFAAPTLSRFEDMEEMLLLDPVHDVTEQGWPMAAPEEQKKDD
ncbi:MAG: PqqD family protein [Acidobacteriota bacterium]